MKFCTNLLCCFACVVKTNALLQNCAVTNITKMSDVLLKSTLQLVLPKKSVPPPKKRPLHFCDVLTQSAFRFLGMHRFALADVRLAKIEKHTTYKSNVNVKSKCEKS